MTSTIKPQIHLNDKIRNKIANMNCSEPIKEFIRQALYIELSHSDEDRPRVNDDYEKIINEYSNKGIDTKK